MKSEFVDGVNPDTDVKDFTKNSDVSIVLGGGIEISKFRAGLRYNIGVTDLVDDPTGLGLNAGDKMNNRVFQIYVGIKLLGK